jgi:hypothetical protein
LVSVRNPLIRARKLDLKQSLVAKLNVRDQRAHEKIWFSPRGINRNETIAAPLRNGLERRGETKMNHWPAQREVDAHWKRADRVRSGNNQWVTRYSPYFTHALTLTFDETHLWNLQASPKTKLFTKDAVLEFRRKSFRHFGIRLNRLLFGNARSRGGEKLLLVGCLEGLGAGQKPHYHCGLGVPSTRFDVLEDRVKTAWANSRYSGTEVVLTPTYSDGWADYMTKKACFPDRPNVQWECVRIPASLKAHC